MDDNNEGVGEEKQSSLKLDISLIFIKYLSPLIIVNGVGNIKPDTGNLKQYIEDVSVLPYKAIIDWPIGFYRNRETKAEQFLLHFVDGLIILDNLPDSDNFSLYLGTDKTKARIETIDTMSSELIKKGIEKVLYELSLKY